MNNETVHIHRPHLVLCSISQRWLGGSTFDACCRNPELLSDTLILITLEQLMMRSEEILHCLDDQYSYPKATSAMEGLSALALHSKVKANPLSERGRRVAVKSCTYQSQMH
jgi:hypothetical protein